MKNKMDMYDKKILYELDKDARLPSSIIAKKVRLSKEATAYRIRKLIEYKHIKYFYALINATNIGYRYFKVFIKFINFEKTVQDKVIDYLKKESCCASISVLEGIYDLSFITIHNSSQELNLFWRRFTNAFGNYLLSKEFHSVVASYKMNLNSFFPGDSLRTRLYHGKIKYEDITELDKQLLKTFATKARVSIIDLARALNKSSSTIMAHKKYLEKKGIIAGYSTFVDMTKYDKQIIEINICLKNTEAVGKMIDFFDSTNECLFAYELIGHYDVSVKLYLESDARLKQVIESFKQKFSKIYIKYEIAYVYRDINVNWSPLK